MRRLALTLTTTFIILTGGPVQAANQFVPKPKGQTSTIAEVRLPVRKPDKATLELMWQLSHGAPPVAYWEAVAQCETGNDWRNTGRFAGGLGIMNKGTFHSEQRGTWERWGGEQFAPSPDKATKLEQIVVANRIAVFGFQTWKSIDPKVAKRKGIPSRLWYDKEPTSFDGWGCINGNPNLDPRDWGFSTKR